MPLLTKLQEMAEPKKLTVSEADGYPGTCFNFVLTDEDGRTTPLRIEDKAMPLDELKKCFQAAWSKKGKK